MNCIARNSTTRTLCSLLSNEGHFGNLPFTAELLDPPRNSGVIGINIERCTRSKPRSSWCLLAVVVACVCDFGRYARRTVELGGEREAVCATFGRDEKFGAPEPSKSIKQKTNGPKTEPKANPAEPGENPDGT
jgi:hypothetical protein